MFKYLPLTDTNRKDMLKVINVPDVDDLLIDIPSSLRLKKPYAILPRLSEHQLRKHLKANQGTVLESYRGFGAYEHERPAIVDTLSSRQEFLTSYTPYQPEVAQGTLQYIFEWQSMITELTGMEVSNASVYDGPTALAEAMMMAVNIATHRRLIVASPLLPHVEKVIQTYAHYRNIILDVLPSKAGLIDINALEKAMQEPFSAVIFSYPNRYGNIEYFDRFVTAIHGQKALVISYNDPFALSRLKTPGSLGADIVCGEAQSLGLPLSFGGPYLGYLATKMDYVRKMPGRICGYTKDSKGERGFVLTLQAREQHIRREKANSNICSNQSLLALQATIYCASMGKQGLVKAFDQATQAAHYLAQELLKTNLFTMAFQAPFAYEVALTYVGDSEALENGLLQHGYLLGQRLEDQRVIFYCSESKTKTDIDAFVSRIKEVHHGL
jgi:glycine dehydrogenase subunit 1